MFRRADTFYVRVVVPVELRPHIGVTEIRRSLGTTDRKAGTLRALQFAHHLTAAFAEMKKDPAAIRSLISVAPDGSVQLVSPYTAQELADFKTIIGAKPPPPQKPLLDVWNLYAKQRMAEKAWSEKTLHEMYTPIQYYLAHCDAKKLDPWAKTTAAGYPDILLTEKKLSVDTANKHLGRLSTLCLWAADRGYANSNPFARLKIKVGARAKAEKKRRLPYTHGEVEKILSVLDPVQDERHWAILIGLFTGCRINEAAQLFAEDIAEEADIACFHFRPDESKKQQTKGHKSRVVPIHPELVQWGFLAWVRGKPPTGHLFEAVFTHGRDGYGQSASKWYNRTFRKHQGINRDFHSFRHTMQAALDAAGVPKRVINAILGHAAGKSMSMTVYEHGLPIAVLRDAIGKVPANPGRL